MTTLPLLAYSALALLFIVLDAALTPPFSVVLKGLPIVLLIALTWTSKSQYRGLLGTALVLGGFGDALLALDYFVPGLGAFLLGHLFYIALWWRQPRLQQWPRILPVILLSVAAGLFLLPYLGDLAIAVVIYLSIIAVMAASASISSLANDWGLLGVYSFLGSDFIIAYNRFVEPLPWAAVAIMCSYYFAQAAIAHAVISQTRANN